MMRDGEIVLDRITMGPRVCAGTACVRAMRMPAWLAINLVASGLTTAQIMEEHPDLEVEDIRQCLLYGAWLARGRRSRSLK